MRPSGDSELLRFRSDEDANDDLPEAPINSNLSIDSNLLGPQKNLTSLTEVHRPSNGELKNSQRGNHWRKDGANSNLEGVRANCTVLQSEVSLEEITFATLEGKNVVKDHIILCGLSENLQKFFIPLRHKSLKKCHPIVILNEEPPGPQLWAKIRFFPKLYFVRGSAMTPKDLKKVNLDDASKVVLLNKPLFKRGVNKTQK